MCRKQKLREGFTLIEILIVIAVISILVGITLPRFRGMQQEGNIAKAKAELRSLQSAVETYYVHNNNTYPDTGSSALQTALNAQVPRIMPSLTDSVPTDPFSTTGADYVYVMGGTNSKFYIIYSAGPGGNGSAVITDDAVVETNGSSCIYVSNISQDAQP